MSLEEQGGEEEVEKEEKEEGEEVEEEGTLGFFTKHLTLKCHGILSQTLGRVWLSPLVFFRHTAQPSGLCTTQ